MVDDHALNTEQNEDYVDKYRDCYKSYQTEIIDVNIKKYKRSLIIKTLIYDTTLDRDMLWVIGATTGMISLGLIYQVYITLKKRKSESINLDHVDIRDEVDTKQLDLDMKKLLKDLQNINSRFSVIN